jgi:hypothetical protein
MPMASLPQFNPARVRSYILRLPFCTKVLVAAILGLWIATVPFPGIREFGRLEPAKMDLTQSMCFLLLVGEGRGGLAIWLLAFWRARGLGSGELAELTLRALEHESWNTASWSSYMDIRLIHCLCSAPTQSIPSDASQLRAHDLQPLRRNTSPRALRVRTWNFSNTRVIYWA